MPLIAEPHLNETAALKEMLCSQISEDAERGIRLFWVANDFKTAHRHEFHLLFYLNNKALKYTHSIYKDTF